MQTRTSNDGYCHIQEFSVQEFGNVHETLQPYSENTRYLDNCRVEARSSMSESAARKWYGGLTKTQDARDILAKGWQKGADKLSSLKSELGAEIPEAKSTRRKPVWRDDGHTLDVDRALAGQWDCAYRSARRESTAGQQVIEVFSPFGGGGSREAEELMWNGAAAVVLTDVLENAGYSVRLTGFFNNGRHGSRMAVSATRVVIKDAGEHLRTDAVAAVLCHAGLFRTLGFRCLIAAPWHVGSGLGYCMDDEESRSALEAGNEFPQGAIVLPQAFTKSACIEAIRSVLASLSAQER